MTAAPRTALAVALGACCVVGSATAPPADAAPVVTLLSGLLTVNVPASASFSTSGSTVSGSLGTVTVVDGVLGSAGYNVSVSTTGFDLVGATTSTAASHIPPSAAVVRNTATTNGTSSNTQSVALPSAQPVFRLTYTSPVSLTNLSSSYTMSLTITVPAAAAVGRYTGTVTQTVG